MKDRMTARARKVLSLASAEAIRLKHAYIGTEHLLLALLRDETSVAAKLLEGLGLNLKEVRAQAEKMLAPGEEDPPKPPLPMTPKAGQALETAQRQARQKFIGTEHILFGLISEEEAFATQILLQMGVDYDQLYEHVASAVGSSEPGQDADSSFMDDLIANLSGAQETQGVELSPEEELCVAGLKEIPALKELALSAGRLVREKDESVRTENFERAAKLRDAIAELGRLVERAGDEWKKGPQADMSRS